MEKREIGILAGTFDPVHIGHVTFAREAAKVCSLEKVYLLPERSPRHKENVTDFNHRLAMLKLAVKDYPELGVLELPEDQFTVFGTLPKLRAHFAPIQVVFLLGSDVATNLYNWPGLEPLIIGLRGQDNRATVEEIIKKLNIAEEVSYIPSPQPHSASSTARAEKLDSDIDPAVRDYIKAHRLYSV